MFPTSAAGWTVTFPTPGICFLWTHHGAEHRLMSSVSDEAQAKDPKHPINCKGLSIVQEKKTMQ